MSYGLLAFCVCVFYDSMLLLQFVFFTRWGRTGTSGSCKVEGPFDDLEEALGLFEAKFKDKTGNLWRVDDHEDRYLGRSGMCTMYSRRLLLYSVFIQMVLRV